MEIYFVNHEVDLFLTEKNHSGESVPKSTSLGTKPT